jgi:hypothetical protein
LLIARREVIQRTLLLSLLLLLLLLLLKLGLIHGSFQKFCTLYVFSLKMNLFYKIRLQTFNIISIVLYHSGPTFGKVLYSCLDAFVVDVSDYSGHLIRHLLNASEGSGGLSPADFDLFPKFKTPLRGKRFRSIEGVSNEVT